MFVQAYLHTAAEILDIYKGEEPFASFLKKYFGAHKKFGSRDRRHITHLCYCFFRLGKSMMEVSVQERMLAGLFLCSQAPHPILAFAKPQWNESVTEALEYKIGQVQQEFDFQLNDVFPFPASLSGENEMPDFAASFFVQPLTWLRIRPGKKEAVKRKLQAVQIAFSQTTENTLALEPAVKIDEVLEIDKEVVVQDASSQRVLLPLENLLKQNKQQLAVWDCCAASGGKSILVKDYYPNINLTVSDIRASILQNLRNRFSRAGVKNYRWFVADVAAENFQCAGAYDLIICDAPCTGSGTWGRTPEQLYYFQKEKIAYYSSLQKRIVQKVSQCLKKNGRLLYITCSVFKEENEQVVAFIQEQCGLRLQQMQYYTGYQQRADTLFSAMFIL